MAQARGVVDPFGLGTRERQRGGAVVLMVSSVLLALMVLADAEPYLLLLVIGAIAISGSLRWLGIADALLPR